MEQCSICLEGLDNGVTLACGHRFHAACLAQMASAVGTAATRRGALNSADANGPLVPRVRKTSKKRDREEPAAPPAAPPRKRVSAAPPRERNDLDLDRTAAYLL